MDDSKGSLGKGSGSGNTINWAKQPEITPPSLQYTMPGAWMKLIH